jgi:Inositol polyphosphate kinase
MRSIQPLQSLALIKNVLDVAIATGNHSIKNWCLSIQPIVSRLLINIDNHNEATILLITQLISKAKTIAHPHKCPLSFNSIENLLYSFLRIGNLPLEQPTLANCFHETKTDNYKSMVNQGLIACYKFRNHPPHKPKEQVVSLFGSHNKDFMITRNTVRKIVSNREGNFYKWVQDSASSEAIGFSRVIPKILLIQSSDDKCSIKMERIGGNSTHSSTMDIKIGTITVPSNFSSHKKAKEANFIANTIQGVLGFRYKGYSILDANGNEAKSLQFTYDYYMKNNIKTIDQAVAIMIDFLSLNNSIAIKKEAVKQLIDECGKIYNFIKYASKTELIGTSLFLAYSPHKEKYDVKIIDFNYYNHHEEPNFVDRNFLGGLSSVKSILETILIWHCI